MIQDGGRKSQSQVTPKPHKNWTINKIGFIIGQICTAIL